MPSYVAFLRAINLGATRKFPKEAIKACAESVGCTGVATHINTGNVLLTTRLRSRAKLEQVLEEAFVADRGFEVPTIAFTLAELVDLADDIDRLAVPGSDRQYVTLLKQEPSAEAARALAALEYDGEHGEVSGRAVHLSFTETAYHSVKFNNATLEKLFGVATTRDAKVIRALAQKWGKG
ncbi:DUF1697 domain-containing protein [Nocardioides sp.]|uniref:DUF1697 domain-containing protein n=1 Tax=Nocardioides sp. TaxID=35761 RepID=UPI003D14181D